MSTFLPFGARLGRQARTLALGLVAALGVAPLRPVLASSTTALGPTATVLSPTGSRPVIVLSTNSLDNFGNVAVGAASAAKSFTVRGTGFGEPLMLMPMPGFEIRLPTGAFACCPLTLAPTAGDTLGTTTVEVRFVPTEAHAYTGTVFALSGGTMSPGVSVAGTGVAAVYPATLSTAAVTNLTGTSATVGGTIASDGGSPVTARGVVWSTAANPTVLLATKTTDGSGAGTFGSTLGGLVPGTTYHLRAYATNALGTTYGEELTFTPAVPLAAQPTAQATVALGPLGTTSVQLLLGGPSQKRLVVARLGSATVPDTLVRDATTYAADTIFGRGQALGNGFYAVYSGSGNRVNVSGLQPNTAYTFAVYAFNDDNTPYAENYRTASPATLGVTTATAPAALLLTENFDYPAGTLLTANNWTAHSGAGTKPITVVAGSLAQAGYDLHSGNAAALTGNGEDVNRSFTAVAARTPIYAAFLVRVASASTTGDYFFHFGPQTIGTTFRGRVFVRRTASGKVQFGTSSGSGAATYIPTEYPLDSTNLLVVKYVFDESSNTSSLYVNPTGATEPATPDATATETGTSPAAPNDNIGSVALRQGSNSPNLVVDGLRVGTAFELVKTGRNAPPTAPDALVVLYQNGNGNPTDRTIDPFWQVVNRSSAPIPLNELSVRYYLTPDSPAPLAATIGYADLGTAEVQARYVALPQPLPGAQGYVEYTFASTKALGPGASTGAIVSHLNKQDYSPFNEADDYSYAPNTDAYLPNTHITVYRNGTLVGGTEPALGAAQLQAQSGNLVTDTTANILSVAAQLTNLGTTPMPYQDLTLRYWFTPDGPSTLEGFVGYAALGSNHLNLSFGQAGTVPYAELHFDASLGTLGAQAASGTVVFHVHKSDWSAFNQANDYSFRPSQDLASNPHVTVYQQGKLVYGQEPAGVYAAARASVAALRTAAPATSALAPVFEAFPNPFTEQTTLHFRPATAGPARLVVYNTLGQVVRTLFDGPTQAGQEYSFTLAASGLNAGAYVVRLQADGHTQTLRLLLNK